VTADSWLTLVVIVAVLVLLVRDLVPPVAAIMGAVITLLLLGVVDAPQAFAGFSNTATITIAALFVVARAVRATGGVHALVARVLGGGGSDRRVLGRLVAPVVGFSGVLNNTPIVATLAPLVRNWAETRNRPPSRYLMPLSFAAILGGLITTIGTSTTLVVSGVMRQSGLDGLSLFEVTPVGLPVALLGATVLVLTARSLLPDRTSPTEQLAARGREYTFRMRVEPDGAVDGLTVAAAGLRNLEGVFLASVDRDELEIAPVGPDDVLVAGDLLTFVGRIDHVRDLQMHGGLASTEEEHVDLVGGGGHRFYEVVIGATSGLVGRSLKEVGFRERYDGAVMAIHRAGARVEAKLGQVRLHVGDVLLVLSDRGFADRWRDKSDFLLVTALDDAPQSRPAQARFVMAVVVAMVVAAGTGVVPILEASLGAVLLLVLGRALTVGEARDAVDLDVLLIVAGSIGLGEAVAVSGLSGAAADVAGEAAGAAGEVGALAVILLATLLLTEMISNTAAAALMVPIAIDVATGVGAEPRGFAIGVAMIASASFLTPVGYQTNTMVYGMGGYRYTDYIRLGLPLTAVVYALTLALVPVLWG
jgi:di/tricarboxylate transporter